MVRRVCSRLCRIALGTVIVLFLLLLVCIWRLVEKPVSLKLLTPYIDMLLPPSFTGLQMDVQDVVLAWHRQANRIVLSAHGIHMRDAQGLVDVSLPTVDVTLSLQTLLRQRAMALKKVYIDGAQLHLQTGTHDLRSPPTPLSMLSALETVVAALESRPLFAELSAVHVVNSAATLYNTAPTRPLRLSQLAMVLGRAATHMSGNLRFTASLSDTDVRFELDSFYERSDRQLTLKSEFENLRPAAFAALHPTLSSLSGFSMPFTGSLSLVLNPQNTWPEGGFTIQGDPGHVMLSGLYREPLQINGFTARGHLNGANKTLRIETATLDLGASKHDKPRLQIQTSMTGLSRPRRIEGDVTLTAFTMADLDRYWPHDVGQAPRQWIMQNIPEGLIHQAKAHFVLGAPKGNQHALMVQDITGSLAYEGLDVHYLRPLPPIQNVTGKGQFNRSGLHFQVESGDLEKMLLTSGHVDITGLDRPERAIAIRTGITGSLGEAIALLNHPRLDLIAGLGMPLEAATGRFQVEPKIAFALNTSVQMKDIDINVQGILQDVSLQEAVLSQDLSNGQLRIDLDKHRMSVEGQAEWADIPLSLTWDAILNPSNADGWRNQMHVVIPRVGHAGRARLGYDFPGLLKGPMAAVIHMQSSWDAQQTVDLQLDLRETALHVPLLDWHKPAGESAKAGGRLQITANREAALTDLHLETDVLKARGRAQFDGTALTHINFPHVTFGTSALRDVVFQPLHPGLAITIGDGFLDATPLQQLLANPSVTPNTDGTQPPAAFPVHLYMPRLHRVQTAPGRYLQNVRAHLAWNGASWNTITASGQVPAELTRRRNSTYQDAKTFDFRYLPTAQQQPNLSLQTNDIGAVLRALNIYDNLIGGDLTLAGYTNPEGTGIKANVQAAQFTVLQAPVIAHVMAAASLHGLTNLLSHDGLKFDNLNAEMTLYSDRLTIARSSAHGGSLGITANGDMVYQGGGLDLQGTIIPAYLINGMLGQVPVVNLLVGGKGQGLVAVNYRLTGELAKPHVLVNPISALTPGFLRGIFRLFTPSAEGNAQPFSPELAPEQDMQTDEP